MGPDKQPAADAQRPVQRHKAASGRSRRMRDLRRLAQAANLALWFALLFGVAVPRVDDLYLTLDPLAGIASAVAGRVLWTGLVFAGATLLLTLLLGRVFCGWICPLGTLLDVTGAAAGKLRSLLARLRGGKPIGPRPAPGSAPGLRHLKLLLLLLVLAAAPFGLQLACLLDPLPLLGRAVGLAGIPQVARPVAIPPPGIVPAGWSAALLLAGVLLLSLAARRWWCRYLCPLGALLSLVARCSLLKLVSRSCTACHRCASTCPMGVRDLRQAGEDSECIRCYSCAVACPQQGVHLGRRPGRSPLALPEPGRRAALAALGGGALLGASSLVLARPRPPASLPPLRPPWAVDEEQFLARCLRCGACIRACPTGTLRAFFLEQGPLALWTPELVPTLGGCVADCTACADACPTGAIAPFTRETKYRVKAGMARFDLRHCVAYGPWERPCSRCLMVCPTAAFRIHRCMETGVPKPRAIIEDRCVGCGLCEYVCVLETRGRPALVTTAAGRGEPTKL